MSSIISTYFVTVSTAQQGATSQPTVVADNEYQVGAVMYMQKAAEFRALSYQAFNVAKIYLDADFDKKNLKQLPKAELKMPRAVVVDVDETVLDNSQNTAYLIKNRMPYSPAIWTDWVKMKKAKPMPGAVDFLNYAKNKGVRIFYVTNRNTAEKEGTIGNLKDSGFPDVSEETVMVKTTDSGKEIRRGMISKDYRIVLLMGDNLNDLSELFEKSTNVKDQKATVAERLTETDKAREMFGRKYIVLPNAIYGAWEDALYNYDRNLSEAEKAQKRQSSIESY